MKPSWRSWRSANPTSPRFKVTTHQFVIPAKAGIQCITAAYDDLTPGEATGILTESLMRDLLPKSQREAVAEAATPTKSE